MDDTAINTVIVLLSNKILAQFLCKTIFNVGSKSVLCFPSDSLSLSLSLKKGLLFFFLIFSMLLNFFRFLMIIFKTSLSLQKVGGFSFGFLSNSSFSCSVSDLKKIHWKSSILMFLIPRGNFRWGFSSETFSERDSNGMRQAICMHK